MKWIKRIYNTDSLKDEVWKFIKDSKYYYVSNLGRIKSINRYTTDSVGRNMFRSGRILMPIKDNNGYLGVKINGKRYRIHRLLAIYFIENPQNKPFIDHINTIRDDNRIENLRWCDRIENANNPITIQKIINNSKGRKHSLITRRKMSNAKIGKPKEVPVIQMDMNGLILNTFSSMAMAERYTGINRRNISSVIRGNIKSTHNYKWELQK